MINYWSLYHYCYYIKTLYGKTIINENTEPTRDVVQ